MQKQLAGWGHSCAHVVISLLQFVLFMYSAFQSSACWMWWYWTECSSQRTAAQLRGNTWSAKREYISAYIHCIAYVCVRVYVGYSYWECFYVFYTVKHKDLPLFEKQENKSFRGKGLFKLRVVLQKWICANAWRFNVTEHTVYTLKYISPLQSACLC